MKRLLQIILFLILTNFRSVSGQSMDCEGCNVISIANEKMPSTFYNEDFAAGLSNGWQVIDSNGFNEIWKYTLIGPQGNGASIYDALQSPTANNGYVIMDDDYFGNNNTNTITALISPPIDCSGKSKVRLKMYQYYKHYTNCRAVIYATKNGTTWTQISAIHNGMTSLQTTSNPDAYEVDMSVVAANEPAVRLMFVYEGDWGYFWEIDDISLYVPDQNDAGLLRQSGLQSSCNASILDTISIAAKNYGYQTFSVLPVGYTINNGPVQNQNFSQLMNQLQWGNFAIQPVSINGAGKYDVKVFTQLPGDQNNTNDTLSTTIYVGPIDVQANSYTQGFEATDDVNAWTIEDTDQDGVTFDFPVGYAHSGVRSLRMPWIYFLDTIAENWIFSPCLDLKTGVNYSSHFYYQTANDTQQTFSIEMYLCNNVNSNSTLNSIGYIAPTNDTTYLYHNSNFSVNNNGTYYLGFKFSGANVKCARRIDDLQISVANAYPEIGIDKLGIEVYPNPCKDYIYVYLPEQYRAPYTYTVYDAMGRQIFSYSYNGWNKPIHTAPLATGVYILEVITNNERYHTRFIKE